jgi:hypothetical protein
MGYLLKHKWIWGLAAALVAAFLIPRQESLAMKAERVHNGMTLDEVCEILGPHYSEPLNTPIDGRRLFFVWAEGRYRLEVVFRPWSQPVVISKELRRDTILASLRALLSRFELIDP